MNVVVLDCRYSSGYSPGHPQGPGTGGLGSQDYVRVRQKRHR